MNIRDFADKFGISAIVRRHFGYRKPVSDQEMGGYPTRGALTYMRAFDKSRLGLTHQESAKAFAQGQKLGELAVAPGLIICGDDLRNFDGASATAEALAIPVITSPAVTYPHYTGFAKTRDSAEQYGDYNVHRYLASGEPGLLWSETPETFEARITSAVLSHYGSPVLFDLNFEQVTLLYFLHVKGLKRQEIPFDKGAWTPKMGGGIVYSEDRKVAMEFLPDFTIVE